MSAKPSIIYVSGAPGAGKTTLSRLLSEQLYIPHVSSDLIHGGVALTHPNHDRHQTLKEVFVPTLVDYAKHGVSCIADHVLQKGVSESDIIDKLKPHANIIYIHVEATDPLGRYVSRVNTSTLPSVVKRREHLLGLVNPHIENLAKTSKALNLGVPTLVVDADAAYKPTIDEITKFISDHLSEN